MPVTRWLVLPVLLAGFLACDVEKVRRDRHDDDSGGEGGETEQPGSGGTSGNGGRGGGIAASGTGGSVEAAGESGSGDPGAGGSAATGGTGAQASGGDDAGGNGATGGMAGGDGGTASGTGGDAGSAATGGSSGDAGSAGTGNASGAGGSANSCGTLIDDMEAGTGYVCQDAVRTGSWFSYHGPSSTLTPAGEPVPTSMLGTPHDGSTRAMRIHGTNGDYAGFGCWLTTTPTTYDASAYTGLRFWAMGTPSTISLVVQTSATTATEYGGTCTLATLSCAGNSTSLSLDAITWQEYSIPFSSLMGGTATFDRADIWSIEFQSPQGSGAYDIWIDDLRFY